jgi:hypothetical protein
MVRAVELKEWALWKEVQKLDMALVSRVTPDLFGASFDNV